MVDRYNKRKPPCPDWGAQHPPLGHIAASRLTRDGICAMLLGEGRGQALARENGPGADSPRPEFLDDVGFLELVERLARLSLVDFLAVFQGARYRRRFEEDIQPNQRCGEAPNASGRTSS